MKIVAIIFGGASSEHRESIKAAKILYKNINRLFNKYKFEFFYLTFGNKWATRAASKAMIKGKLPIESKYTRQFDDCDSSRIIEIRNIDVIYNTMMGDSGENGNIMGLADIFKKPIIGCGILASALCQNKYLSKILAYQSGIQIVDYLYVDKDENLSDVVQMVKKNVGYPCFVKPDNLGTCSYVFKANNEKEFVEKFKHTVKRNHRSDKYLVEKYIDNIEVRIFVFQDTHDKIHTNDLYVTKLNESHLDGDDNSLFKHFNNNFPSSMRKKICDYAIKIFKLFGMKDYARIDFFVENSTGEIYFNEVNTQPFIGKCNIEYMEKDGLSYQDFFDMMIKRNI